jgi:hypothetical protein
MSGSTVTEYLVQRFGGTAMPNDAALQSWMYERAADGWRLITVDDGVGYFERTRAPIAPANTEVPFVSQEGTALHCTMGNWTEVPTSYAYQWKIDGANKGTDSPDYTRVAADVGKTATCVVTASNAAGSGTAPASNGVVVS